MNNIRHRVGIKADLNDVYQACFHPEKLQDWWAASASGSPRQGEIIQLEFPGYPNFILLIHELLSDTLVHLKLIEGPDPWHGSELIFEFEETKNQVFVTFTHKTTDTTPPEAFLYFCTKWPLFLVSLKNFLETGQGNPFPNDVRIQHD